MSHTPTTLYDNQLKVDTYIFYEKNVNPTTVGGGAFSSPPIKPHQEGTL